MKPKILFFMATSSQVGGVGVWLDRATEYLSEHGFDPVVGLVQGLKYNDPRRFRRFHQNLNTIIVDGRACNRASRVRACQQAIRKVEPVIVIPLGIVDANEATLREKRHRPLYLLGRTQGNLAEMLLDLEIYRHGLDHVICDGVLTRDFLMQHGSFPADRIEHIPNGSDKATTERLPRVGDAPLRLAFVGRFTHADKRVLDIPVLCQHLLQNGTPFQLTIVGAGPDEEELRSRLEPFREHVEIIGTMKHDELYKTVFPSIDILLLFSASESFGIVLAEAMMNGVVPVTSQYTGFFSERLVVDGVHGLSFPVGDMAAAAAAVAQLHADNTLLKRLSNAAVKHATSNYTWEQSLKSWTNALHSVLARPPIINPTIPVIPGTDQPGRLEKMHIPEGIIDALRRMRLRLFGSPVPPGGEEWPLYYRHHTEQQLAEVKVVCQKIEINAMNIPFLECKTHE